MQCGSSTVKLICLFIKIFLGFLFFISIFHLEDVVDGLTRCLLSTVKGLKKSGLGAQDQY